ncbi:MAG: SGNH/GDSL hydrolase family protein [Ahniella sp.]|nr:SGNH/GDSL hydrolase family protein [Ahniella sp.]
MSLVFDAGQGKAARGFLALGDSYTIGEGVAVAERWPSQFAALCRDKGVDLGEPVVIAQTGWTTDELDAAIDTAELGQTLRPPYALVSLLIGVNNQYRGRDLGTYEVDYAGLLARAIRFAGDRPDRVLALSIPDWGVTAFAAADARGPTAIGTQIDAYNQVAQRLCASHGVVFINITDISRQYPDWLVADQLHPDARQYLAWAKSAAEGYLLPSH